MRRKYKPKKLKEGGKIVKTYDTPMNEFCKLFQ
jgi:hypothetical protein